MGGGAESFCKFLLLVRTPEELSAEPLLSAAVPGRPRRSSVAPRLRSESLESIFFFLFGREGKGGFIDKMKKGMRMGICRREWEQTAAKEGQRRGQEEQ